MADIDYSIASKAAPPKFDPLAMAGEAVQLGQGLLNNRILGQQADANLPSLEAGLRKVQIAREQAGLTNEQWNLAGNALLPLIEKFGRSGVVQDEKGNKTATISTDDVSSALTDLMSNTALGKDPNFVARATSLITSLPKDDPKAIMDHLYGVALMANPTTERVAQLNGGAPQAVSTGGQTNFIRTPTLGGVPPQLVGQIKNTLSPGEASTPTPVLTRNPDGTLTPSNITRQQFVDTAGGGPLATAPPMTSEGVPLATAGNPAYSVQDPGTGQPGIVTQGGAAAAAARGAAPPPVHPTGPLPGLVPATTATAEQNVQQAQALQKRAAIVPQRRAALSELVGTLDNFTPGPKANLTGGLNGLATEFGIPLPGATTGKAAQDTFNKLAAQIALDQWGSLGGSGSNEQLATAVHANPNDAMSKMGIKNVTALLQGNEDAIQAQFDAWQKYSKVHGPDSYGSFLGGWNRYYDPRVFQAEHMSAPAVRVMKSQMSAKELADFNRKAAVAKAAGWLGAE